MDPSVEFSSLHGRKFQKKKKEEARVKQLTMKFVVPLAPESTLSIRQYDDGSQFSVPLCNFTAAAQLL